MRLHGLDVARFLAFTGMVLVNFRIVSGTGFSGDIGSVITQGLEGRAAALFVVLAGIGVSLSRAAPGLLLRRAAFLFAIGLVNMTVFEADILHFYALYFVLAAAFVTRSDTALVSAALAVLGIAVILFMVLDYNRGWDWQTLAYADVWTVPGFLRHSLFNGWHPVFPWAALLLVGMWAGRRELGNRAVQIGFVVGGTAASLLASVPQRMVQSETEAWYLLNTAPVPPGPFYVLAGAGSALAVVGAVLLLAPGLDRLRLGPVLAAPGRQTLTLYAAHILIGMGAMEAMGWLDGALTPGAVFWGSLGFCGLAAAYAVIWHRWVKRGPLEALMRRIAG